MVLDSKQHQNQTFINCMAGCAPKNAINHSNFEIKKYFISEVFRMKCQKQCINSLETTRPECMYAKAFNFSERVNYGHVFTEFIRLFFLFRI